MKQLFFAVQWTLVSVLVISCNGAGIITVDPVYETMRAKLGPENPQVPKGPLHRPGQPCTVCHSDLGGEPVFAVAGTVYRDDQSDQVLADVDVRLIDSTGAKFSVRTNCAGNFWLTPGQFSPRWPLWVTLEMGETKIDMESPIQRETACAFCHSEPRGPTSAGRVFLTDDPALIPTIAARPCRPGEEGR